MNISLYGGRSADTRRITDEPAHFYIFINDLGKKLTCEVKIQIIQDHQNISSMQKVTKTSATPMGVRDNIVIKAGVYELHHRKVHNNTHGKITTLHLQ